MKKSLASTFVAACLGLAGVASVASGQEIYRQDPINSWGGYSSQDAQNPGGLGWFSEVVDDFPATAGASIGHVEFWGGYAQDVPGNTHGFIIRFYESEDAIVSTRLAEITVNDFEETEYYSTEIPPLGTLRGYHYSVELPTPFVVPHDGQYWMSVVAILDRGGTANEPQWGWIQAPFVQNFSGQQWFFNPGNFQSINTDFSFVLSTGGGGGTTCDGDVNCDGNLDGFDVQAMEQAVGGDNSSFCQADSDFNHDGNLDGFDVQAVEAVVGGADCP